MKLKRFVILLFIDILFLAGCDDKEEQPIAKKQNVEIAMSMWEDEIDNILEYVGSETEEEETEVLVKLKPENDNQSKETLVLGLKKTSEWQEECEVKMSNQDSELKVEVETVQEMIKSEVKSECQLQQRNPTSYNPQNVVELAVEKTKAYGKVYIPDDLNNMLSAGMLSREEYNMCYPTDGAGYIEFYVASDMNEARDVSGTIKFNSEEDIATNIAGMYNVLPQQYFYIEYRGTVMYGDKECYVFYCYRS